MKTLLPILVLSIAVLCSIAFWQSRWHRWDLRQYETFKINAPGISERGFTLCPEGCEVMQDPNHPALVDGKRVDSFANADKNHYYCSVLELVDQRDKYSEGGTILYDSCDKGRTRP